MKVLVVCKTRRDYPSPRLNNLSLYLDSISHLGLHIPWNGDVGSLSDIGDRCGTGDNFVVLSPRGFGDHWSGDEYQIFGASYPPKRRN